jgi:uncharacterized protein (TIGR03083 family)
MNRDEVWQTIDEQRSGVADLLDDLSPDEWETPSLCTDWRVREVAAHLTFAHVGLFEAAGWMLRARGGFDRMIRDSAIHRAKLPVERYPGMIRAMVGSRKKAPGISHLEPLIDILVHEQDIAIPLGRTRPMPAGAAAVAATRVWTMGRPFHAQRTFSGLELVATDHPWSVGQGLRVEGPMAALLLLVTKRSAALAQLSGPGVAKIDQLTPR